VAVQVVEVQALTLVTNKVDVQVVKAQSLTSTTNKVINVKVARIQPLTSVPNDVILEIANTPIPKVANIPIPEVANTSISILISNNTIIEAPNAQPLLSSSKDMFMKDVSIENMSMESDYCGSPISINEFIESVL